MRRPRPKRDNHESCNFQEISNIQICNFCLVSSARCRRATTGLPSVLRDIFSYVSQHMITVSVLVLSLPHAISFLPLMSIWSRSLTRDVEPMPVLVLCTYFFLVVRIICSLKPCEQKFDSAQTARSQFTSELQRVACIVATRGRRIHLV